MQNVSASYIAVPDWQWSSIWDNTPPSHRYIEEKSPLAQLGWKSMLNPADGKYYVTCKDDGTLHPSMKTEADKIGCPLVSAMEKYFDCPDTMEFFAKKAAESA